MIVYNISIFKQLLYTLPTNTFFICTTSYDVERLEPEIFGYQLIENVVIRQLHKLCQERITELKNLISIYNELRVKKIIY